MPRKKNRRAGRANCWDPTYLAERLEGRTMLAADVVISELMAKNKTTLQDNVGAYSDWLELHNAGDAPQDLTGWYLTDTTKNLTEWQFPAGMTLAAGDFAVVFASGQNISTLGQPLHTNFKLDDGGEYLALVQPDGTTIQYQYSPTFPAQSADISYGMADDDDPNSPLQYFSLPTPGAANQPDAATVTFSQPGGSYLGAAFVELSTTTPDAEIRYTTDGSVPTSASPIYSSMLILTRDTMLRARAFATGFTASVVSSQQYFVLDSSVATFHSNLPLIVLDTYGSAIGQDTQTAASAMVYAAPADGSDTTLLQTPEFVGRAGLNIRGQTSTTFPKLQYHLELWNESNGDTNASLLGMPADSDWILYAPYSEKALMQNELAYKWANEMGEYAVRTQWVEVFLNTGTDTTVNYQDDYAGIYLLEEKIKIAPERVDITKIGSGDDTDPSITGGYIWKKDKPSPDDVDFTTETGQTFVFDDPAGSKLDTTQQAWLTTYINQFETALYGPDFTDPNTGYAHYIDVQSFVDNWIMVEMARNIDGFDLSTYYYKDENGLIHMGPVWDYNLSMGNANYNGGDDPIGWDHDTLTAQQYTYFDRLTQDPAFMQLISQRWQQLRQTIFSNAQITADIQANVQVLTDGNGNIPVGPTPTQTPDNPVVRNFEKWDILGTAVWPNSYVGNSWLDEVNYLQNFMTTRLAWMDAQLDPIAPTGAPSSLLSLTARPLSGVQINLSWVAGDNSASDYLVEQSVDGGQTWVQNGVAALGMKSYVATGLQPGTSYIFRVTAQNSLGSSLGAEVSTATIGATPLLDLSRDFSNASSVVTANGTTTISTGAITLTDGNDNEAASVFTTNQLSVLGFNTAFVFQLTDAAADGFTFTIQNNAPATLGSGGGDLGYVGIHTSVAIKFDLFNNVGEGASSTGLFIDGDYPLLNGIHPIDTSIDMLPSGINLHHKTTFLATLSYDGSSLTETVTDLSSGAVFTHSYTVNIPSLLGASTGYVGFTAGTGLTSAIQQIVSWSYTAAPTLQNVVAGTDGDDTISLQRSADQQYINWTIGDASGAISASDPAGLTLYGNGGLDAINLDYTNGNPLPANVHLNGTFILNGLTGDNPLAGTTLDINQSTVYIAYSDAAPLSMIRSSLAGGYNGGDWLGTPGDTAGVITSWALQQPGTSALGIGYVDSAGGMIPDAPANTVELKVGLWGDTAIAGTVSFTDFMRLTQHYTATDQSWLQGDFNYDGVVDGNDFNLLSPNYGQTMPFLDPVEVTTFAGFPVVPTVAAVAPAPVTPVVPTRPQRVVSLPPVIAVVQPVEATTAATVSAAAAAPTVTTAVVAATSVSSTPASSTESATKKAVRHATKAAKVQVVVVEKPAKVKDDAKKAK